MTTPTHQGPTRRSETIFFVYRGTSIEIRPPSPPYTYRYYIHLCLNRILDEELRRKCWPELEELGWSWPKPLEAIEMHGGMTFCEPSTPRKGREFVKIGCDYAHLWDVSEPTLDQVIEEAKETVDDAIQKLGLVHWCRRCGEFEQDESNGIFREGWFYHNSCAKGTTEETET